MFRKIINLLKLKGVSNVFVFDSKYHSTTLNYLHKLSILSIGPLSITQDLKTLDIVIPTSHDNLFLDFFLIKTFITIKSLVESDKYFLYKKN